MFQLTHTHEPDECAVAFAAWRGFDSPLRHVAALASCASGDDADAHTIWWSVEAVSEDEALAMLPPYVAERTNARPVSEVPIP